MPKTLPAAGTIPYELFHSSDKFFWTALEYGSHCNVEDLRHAFRDGHYNSVYTFWLPADDLTDQMSRVFRDSQNIEHSWRGRGRKECRSTSVGDIIKVGKDYWIIASVGFHLGWHDD